MLAKRSGPPSRCIGDPSLLTRRLLLALGALLPAVPAARAVAQADTSWAAAFIRKVGNEIAAIIAAPGPPEAHKFRLIGLIDRVVDVPGAARFCLGRYWRQASPQQQREYVDLFRAVLMRAVLGRINSEQENNSDQQNATAIQVQVERPEPRPDSIYVPTLIQRRGIPSVTVTWVVNTDASDPRIIDVMAAGVSLRITIRADYAAFLQRHAENIAALLQALRAQACDDCAPPSGVAGR
jgi:phospholipid transport system substrate-binding protein